MKRLILVLLASLIFLLPGCVEAPELPQPPSAPVEKTIEAPAAVIEPEAPAAPVENKQEAAPDEPQPPKEAPEPEPAVKSAAAVPQSQPQQSTLKAAPVESQKPQAPEVKPAQPAAPEAKPQPTAVESTPSPPPEPQTPTPEPEVHIHSYTETVIAPTCETGGYTKHTCSCGDSYTDSATAALGHAYEQTGHADATTVAAGYTEYTCSRCGVSYRDTIPKIIVTGASDADAQRVCDNVNNYISSHYAITQNRGTYMGVTWVTSPSDVQGAINSAIGTVDLYAQYYGAKSFCCGYFDVGGGNYTIVLYWDTI